MGQADWKRVCHSAFLPANQETLGWWDFCLASTEPASKSSHAEAAGPARELGCLSSLQTHIKILLTTSLSRGFNRDLNLKCDTPHRPTWFGPTEPNPLFCSNRVCHIMGRFWWDLWRLCFSPAAEYVYTVNECCCFQAILRRGSRQPTSQVKVLLTGQLSSSPRRCPEPAVGAGPGRCAGGWVHAEPQLVSEVSWYTAIPTPPLLGTSRDFEPENSGEYLSAKTVDTNHEEEVYSGGKSPRGLAFTLGFSTHHGTLYSQ